jgi:hypothetical protein
MNLEEIKKMKFSLKNTISVVIAGNTLKVKAKPNGELLNWIKSIT